MNTCNVVNKKVLKLGQKNNHAVFKRIQIVLCIKLTDDVNNSVLAGGNKSMQSRDIELAKQRATKLDETR